MVFSRSDLIRDCFQPIMFNNKMLLTNENRETDWFQPIILKNRVLLISQILFNQSDPRTDWLQSIKIQEKKFFQPSFINDLLLSQSSNTTVKKVQPIRWKKEIVGSQSNFKTGLKGARRSVRAVGKGRQKWRPTATRQAPTSSLSLARWGKKS